MNDMSHYRANAINTVHLHGVSLNKLYCLPPWQCTVLMYIVGNFLGLFNVYKRVYIYMFIIIRLKLSKS
jgi:hypothetical protein